MNITKAPFAILVLVSFLMTGIIGPMPVYAQAVMDLPMAGAMVSISPRFTPALIRGLTVHQDNPFLFDFIVDPGQSQLSPQALKDESDRMIKYFFAALTIPDKDIWVNLSPYEKDRMVPISLGKTAMGRDLLAQDYMLKQLTASLIYPQKNLGRTFWNKVYTKAKELYGTTQVPVNTFNKVWIVPQSVGIYEHGQTAFIVNGHLKVMLEEDYLALEKQKIATLPTVARNDTGTHALSSQIIRSLILPEIEKEINEGKNFATLRQIFYAQALAVWFKHNLKQALFNRVYANKGTVKGIDQNDAATNEAIYRQYLRAYKKGVFNFIQEDRDPVTQETLPRKYFSGGWDGEKMYQAEYPVAQLPDAAMAASKDDVDVSVVAVNDGFTRRGILKAALTGAAVALLRTRLLRLAAAQTFPKGSPLLVWMRNNVFRGESGRGMPKSFEVPDKRAWSAIGGNTVDGVIERAIINDGLSIYDGAARQIVLAMAGGEDNLRAADIYTDTLNSGSFGTLQTIRAWDVPFTYQGRQLPRGNAYFFRLISPDYLQYDPLTLREEMPGFPESPRIHWTNWMPITGENAWVVIGSMQVAFAKGHGTVDVNSKEFKLARSIFPGFRALKTKIGAILYAPKGTLGKNPDDISNENNISTYAAAMMDYESTYDPQSLKLAQGIEDYFKEYGYDRETHTFYQGGFYTEGIFHPNKEPFAVDVQTWGILGLSPKRIDAWYGQGEAYQIWKATKKRAGYYKDGKLWGVGFTDGHDIQSGEWSFGAIAAALELALYYRDSHPDWARACEADAVSMLKGLEKLKHISKDGSKSYLYVNKSVVIPFGQNGRMKWIGRPIPSLASTAWAFFIQNGINPFKLGGKSHWLTFPKFKAAVDAIVADQRAASDRAMLNTKQVIPKIDKGALAPGGIDLSQQEGALHIERDANGGVKVDVDAALIARVEREGMHEVIPVIINMQPADIRSLLGN